MRWVIDLLIVVMLSAAGYGGWWLYTYQQHEATRLERVHAALDLLHEQTRYHTAMGRAEQEMGLEPPPIINEQWFGPTLPSNPYASAERDGEPDGGRDGDGDTGPLDVTLASFGDHPWLDIAPEEDFESHPPDPILTSADQAQFWFNPQLGVFRARVPAQASARETCELYNLVNRTTLARLPAEPVKDEVRLARQPVRYTPAGVVVDADAARSSLVEPFVPSYGGAYRDLTPSRAASTPSSSSSLSSSSSASSPSRVTGTRQGATPAPGTTSATGSPGGVLPPERRPSLKDR